MGERERITRSAREREEAVAPRTARRAADHGLADQVLRMQATAGNRAVSQWLAGAQAKLIVGGEHDPLEREADRVADAVVQQLDRSRGAGIGSADLAAADDETEIVARRAVRRTPSAPDSLDDGATVDAGTEQTIRAARRGGAALPGNVRRPMEQAFGADFGSVRLHTGPASAALNDTMNAQAFTVGRDIFFSGAAPDVSSRSGQHLLAHELAHTMQQGATPSVVRRRKKKKPGTTPTNSQSKTPPKTTAPTKKKTDEELLDGPLLPVEDPQYKRQIMLRVRRGRGGGQSQQSGGGILSSLWSWMPGSWSYTAPTEDEPEEEGQLVGYGNSELAKGEGGGSEFEKEFGDKEPEAEPEDLKNPLGLSEIEIQLKEGSLEKKGTRVGDVKAKGGLKGTGEGALKMEGSGSIEGSKGKVGAEMKLLRDANGMEGEGKVEFVLGKTGEHKTGTLAWDILGLRLEGDGALEGFAGVKGGVEGKGKYDSKSGEFSGKGKVGGMVGAGTEGTVRVKLKTGDKDLGTVEGKVGVQYGFGGEIFGTIEFKGGTLSFSSGGKLSAGIGGSFSYKVEMNTQALVDLSSSWLSQLWDWMTDTEGLSEEDFWL